MKSVRIWSYSDPYFPAFGLNTDKDNSKNRHFLYSDKSLSFWKPKKHKRSLLCSNKSVIINIHRTTITYHKTDTKHIIKLELFQFSVETLYKRSYCWFSTCDETITRLEFVSINSNKKSNMWNGFSYSATWLLVTIFSLIICTICLQKPQYHIKMNDYYNELKDCTYWCKTSHALLFWWHN